ncbi:hypothetical protein [Mycobacterium sp. C31M]
MTRIQMIDPGRVLVLGDVDSVTISRAEGVSDDDDMARFARWYAGAAGLQLRTYKRPHLDRAIPEDCADSTRDLLHASRKLADPGKSLEIYTRPDAEDMPNMPDVDLSLGVVHAVLPGVIDVRNADDLRVWLHS